jgi:hypothetical protein
MTNGGSGGGSNNDDDNDMITSLLAFIASNVTFQWLKFLTCVPEDTGSNVARRPAMLTKDSSISATMVT